MSSFHDVRFPKLVARGATGGPGFSTDIVTVSGGDEQRNESWDQERSRYDAAPGVRSREQMAEVLAFFRARKGRAYSFRFRDCFDHDAVDQETRPLGGNVYQLVKRYTSGPVSYVRVITKPVAGTVIVKVGGSIVVPAGIDHALGLIFFASTLASTPVASFEFDVHCRFDVDYLAVNLQGLSLQSMPSIPLIEVRR